MYRITGFVPVYKYRIQGPDALYGLRVAAGCYVIHLLMGPDAATMLCYGLVFMGFIKRPHSFHYGAVGFGHVVIVMCGRKPAGSQKGGSGGMPFRPLLKA